MTESASKHLDMVHSVITRMANNSFLIRGWSVTIVSAIVALAQKDARGDYVLVAYFPAAAFWILDGYYLSQERAYRGLFDAVRKAQATESDLSMDARPYLLGRNSWICSTFSLTVFLFHGGIMVTILVVMFLLQ